jgi:hypothetical protein
MLPDFPELKADLSMAISAYFKQRVAIHLGALSKIRHNYVFEGPRDDNHGHEIVRSSGEIESSGLKLMSAELSILADELPKMTLDQVLHKVDEAAQKVASQLAKLAYQRISEAVEQVGNSIDAKGKRLSAELILELYSTVEIDFDRNGKPKMPTFHVHPKMTEALKLALSELENDIELNRELKQIITNKKEEWREREASRKLVG